MTRSQTESAKLKESHLLAMLIAWVMIAGVFVVLGHVMAQGVA